MQVTNRVPFLSLRGFFSTLKLHVLSVMFFHAQKNTVYNLDFVEDYIFFFRPILSVSLWQKVRDLEVDSYSDAISRDMAFYEI